MPLLPQLFAVAAMMLLTYLGLLAFGPPRTKLLFTRAEKQQWDQLVGAPFGSWLAGTNILATLTSFATVVVFFLGNAAVFGWVMFACCATIWLGAFVTNFLTSRISESTRVQELLESPDQTGSIVASVFWRPDGRAKHSSRIVKWVSLANLSAVLWLEFALLADVGGPLLGLSTIAVQSLFLFLVALTVFYFVLRFGIRGVVFTDSFQAPIIVLATLLIIVGALVALLDSSQPIEWREVVAPAAPTPILWLFALHVLFLNSFLVVVTEPHWLRLWVFQKKETGVQARATFSTGLMWAFLILGGFAARALAPEASEPIAAIRGLLGSLLQVSPVFLGAFWFAAIAALFSTADAAVYSLLVVSGFDPDNGKLRERRLADLRPARFALVGSIGMAIAYFAIRSIGLPFEKLIFLVIPLSLNILPGLVLLAIGREVKPIVLYVSLAGYAACSVTGLLQPAQELAWTLAAALVPVVVAGVSLLALRAPREK